MALAATPLEPPQQDATRRSYVLVLLGFLTLYEFFDSYSTSYVTAVVSYIQADFHIDSSVWYVVLGLASLGMIGAWVLQFLADVVGRRPMLILVLFGMGLASLVMLLSRTIVQFGIGFFLLYVCFSSDIWIIILSEEAPENRRARYASLITVVGALGALAIPASRSLLIHATPAEDPTLWRTMTYLAILALPLSLLGLGLRETQAFRIGAAKPTKLDWRASLKIAGQPFSTATRSFMHVFLVVGAVSGMLLGVYSTVEAYLSGLTSDVAVVNRLIAVAALGTLTFFGAAGPMADKFGRKITYCLLLSLSFLSVVLLVVLVPDLLKEGRSLTVSVIVFLCNGSFWGAMLVSKIHCMECFPTEIRGTSSGWRTLSFALGIASGSLAAGALASVVPLGAVYLVFAALAIAVAPPLVLRYLPETRGLKIVGIAG